MSVFLFAAHDPGGALMLSAAAGEAATRGHRVVYAASGPAVDLWRNQGCSVVEVEDADGLSEMSGEAFSIVATGTGFGTFEQDCWDWARRAGVPSIAVIDAWTNFAVRFEKSDGVVQPDAVAVIDGAAKKDLEAFDWMTVPVFSVGQPHLQKQTQLLLERRSDVRQKAPQTIVFFSEPVREDYKSGRGFTQFEAFEMLVSVLADSQRLEIWVKAHPREDPDAWKRAVSDASTRSGVQVCQVHGPAVDLLVDADGIVGMTTMVLIEGHLAGVPVLSLQPGRTSVVNPKIDEIGRLVTDPDDMPSAWSAFLADVGGKVPVRPEYAAMLDAADVRFVDAAETTIAAARS